MKHRNRNFDTHIVGGSSINTDYERKYSPWSAWSVCSKKCKQVRMRRCVKAAHCGGAILREERRCYVARCKLRSPLLSTKSTLREPDNLHHFAYSDWSQWTACSPSCEATRYKVNPQLPLRLHLPSNTSDIKIQCGIARIATSDRSLKILGGHPAPRGKWPWQVVILNRYKEAFCGGTLVASSWVLTAAHCARRRLFVRLGEHDLTKFEESEEEIRVTDVFIHPHYDTDTVDNDIALLKLSSPAHYDNYVIPACIPHHTTSLPVDRMCVILGWGKERHGDQFGSNLLHEAQVPIVERDECLDVYEEYFISHNMFCAGYKRGKVDSCAGDSGGPLLCNVDGKWNVMGITSFGEGCGRKDKYGIYTKVPNFTHWLHRIIKRQS
uniref:Peptidase S1 domain-containing protein n=1 Tax=Strigamia maritima TaxID=126957 RepID=T1JFB1_STRMM